MEDQFSQGEWNIRGNKIFIDNGYKGVALAYVQKNYKPITFEPIEDVEAIANINLMAASPKLLAACKQLIKEIEAGQTISIASYLLAKNAIEKAQPKKLKSCPVN